ERHCVSVPAFWFLRFVSFNLVLRFGHAFCLKTSCVLPEDKLRFAVKHVAFWFKARSVLLQRSLHFASRHAAFCFKTSYVLLQDPCVLSQDSCVLTTFEDLNCDLGKTLRFGSCVLVPAFCLFQFGSAIWSCVLLKDKLRLPEDKLRFAVKHVAFWFKARSILLQRSLHFASRHAAFCFKTSYVLLQDPCVLSQDSCVLSQGGTTF
nr:hypothetical protein [Tanacetum cinerariifolium]